MTFLEARQAIEAQGYCFASFVDYSGARDRYTMSEVSFWLATQVSPSFLRRAA